MFENPVLAVSGVRGYWYYEGKHEIIRKKTLRKWQRIATSVVVLPVGFVSHV